LLKSQRLDFVTKSTRFCFGLTPLTEGINQLALQFFCDEWRFDTVRFIRHDLITTVQRRTASGDDSRRMTVLPLRSSFNGIATVVIFVCRSSGPVDGRIT
jgi:hypothetical protein